MPSVEHCDRGRLISIEGLNGVGKTYLTSRVVDAASERGQPPLVVEEFSRRADGGSDLGRRLLRTLITASDGERFLRAGSPGRRHCCCSRSRCTTSRQPCPHCCPGAP